MQLYFSSWKLEIISSFLRNENSRDFDDSRYIMGKTVYK